MLDALDVAEPLLATRRMRRHPDVRLEAAISAFQDAVWCLAAADDDLRAAGVLTPDLAERVADVAGDATFDLLAAVDAAARAQAEVVRLFDEVARCWTLAAVTLGARTEHLDVPVPGLASATRTAPAAAHAPPVATLPLDHHLEGLAA